MTRRRVALGVLALVALAASACDSSTSSGRHWRRSSGEQTIVVWQPDASLAPGTGWLTALERARAAWSENPRVEIQVRPCLPGENCLPVRVEDLPGDNSSFTSTAATVEGSHMVAGDSTFVVLDSTPVRSQAAKDQVVCHEAGGHGLGLHHSDHLNEDGTLGPCMGGVPTEHDHGLIVTDYGHVDPTGPPGI